MPRNKYPEQTVQKILDTASRFFIEKGYDKTSIQDIMDELGLSKGAIYHHFKSKDEIFQAVIQRSEEQGYAFLRKFMDDSEGKTGKERIEALFQVLADVTLENTENSFLKLRSQNPLFFLKGLQSNMKNDAQTIADLIRIGNEDGSFHAEDPEMVAETMLMLFNVWTNPIVFNRDYDATERRFRYLQKTMKNLGVDVFSDELITVYLDIYNRSGMMEHDN